MEKTKVYIMHSSHLDLYWIGAQEDCLNKGAIIIEDALIRAKENSKFHFLIETARFLEYYIAKYPHRLPDLKALIDNGQFEVAACYTDRLENHVDGESLVRNILYGKKIIKNILGIDSDITCHPDLPGFAEQTPQIYKKSGIRYYLSARGFKNGARFNWEGLDGSNIIMYNVPGHYAYYDMEEVLSEIDETKKMMKSDFVLLGCSAGDMGAAGTFIARENGKGIRYDLVEFIDKIQSLHPEFEFELANAGSVLDRMNTEGLDSIKGESPSRWGHHGSAMNTEFYFLDKKVTATLLDAEKMYTLADMLGIPVEFKVERHPLMHPGGAAGRRRYFELDFMPSNINEWIEYCWRLQVITQDHNFGGVDGAQTHFDRIIYKTAALKIAESIRDLSLNAIIQKRNNASDNVVVFNTLNWERSQIVEFQTSELEDERQYIAEDCDGNIVPVYKSGDKWTFLACDVPSVGFKTYRICQGKVSVKNGWLITETQEMLTVQNNYYRLVIDKSTGELVSLYDLELGKDWADKSGVLIIQAFEDKSFGGSERIMDKRLLDISSANFRGINITSVTSQSVEVELITEVCDVKVRILLTLYNNKKYLGIKVNFNWPGIPDMQLKMKLCKRNETSRITYGVPYGMQEYGKYMETNSLKFGSDEISIDVFTRYREVQGWFAVDDHDCGLAVSSNHSAYDFYSEGVNVMLLRDVRNGGENDVRFSNYGLLGYDFNFTSYEGDWAMNDTYKMYWEQQHPLIVTSANGDAGKDPVKDSLITTDNKGVLTVLAKSMHGDGKYIARLYNPTPQHEQLLFKNKLNVKVSECVCLDESPCADPLDELSSFVIKTLLLEKDIN